MIIYECIAFPPSGPGASPCGSTQGFAGYICLLRCADNNLAFLRTFPLWGEAMGSPPKPLCMTVPYGVMHECKTLTACLLRCADNNFVFLKTLEPSRVILIQRACYATHIRICLFENLKILCMTVPYGVMHECKILTACLLRCADKNIF